MIKYEFFYHSKKTMEQFDEFLLYTILEFGDINPAEYAFQMHKNELVKNQRNTQFALANKLRLLCRKFYYIICRKPFHKWTMNIITQHIDGKPYMPRLLYYSKRYTAKYAHDIIIGKTIFVHSIPPTGTFQYASILSANNIERMHDVRVLYTTEKVMKYCHKHNIIMRKCTTIKCNNMKKKYFKCIPNAHKLIKSVCSIENLGEQLIDIELDNSCVNNTKNYYPNVKKVRWFNYIPLLDDHIINELTSIFPNAVITFN